MKEELRESLNERLTRLELWVTHLTQIVEAVLPEGTKMPQLENYTNCELQHLNGFGELRLPRDMRSDRCEEDTE